MKMANLEEKKDEHREQFEESLSIHAKSERFSIISYTESRGDFNFICKGGVWPQDWKIDPCIRRLNLAKKQTHCQTICNRN